MIKKYSYAVSLILISLYAVLFLAVSAFRYYSFSYTDFDLAIHAQTLWSMTHGSIYCSILGVPFIGNHVQPILFLIAPLYKLIPHPVTPLVLQTISLALAGLVIFKLAAEILDPIWALILTFAYVLYPALGYANFYEFHPTTFATLFLSLAFVKFYRGDFRLFIFWSIMAMLCQENIPLIIISFGIYAAFLKKPLKWILFPFLVGALWFWVSVSILKPNFGGETIQYADKLYSHLGKTPLVIASNIILHPIKTAQMLLIKDNRMLFVDLFGPLAVIPLLSPMPLLMALPCLLQHMLSLRTLEHTIYYHYEAEIIPFIFISAIFGIRKLKGLKAPNWLLVSLLVIMPCGFSIYRGAYPKLITNFKTIFVRDDLDNYRDVFVKKIPNDASVLATFQFLPHLANRPKLYSFHYIATGFHTLSTKPYVLPKGVQYALIDFDDPFFVAVFYLKDSDIKMDEFLRREGWEKLDMVNAIVFMKKGSSAKHAVPSSLYEKLTKDVQPQNYAKLFTTPNTEIAFIKGDIGKITEKGLLPLSLFWKCKKSTQKRYGIFVDILDQNSNVVKRTYLPHCYRIYPTYRWKENEVIKENYNLLMPSRLQEGIYDIAIGSYDEEDNRIYDVRVIGKIGL